MTTKFNEHSFLVRGPCRAQVIPREAPCKAVSLAWPFLWWGEDEAMYVRETESLAGRKCDASGTKLPPDAGTSQHSNPSTEGRGWSNT